jgi:hypothetical protein
MEVIMAMEESRSGIVGGKCNNRLRLSGNEKGTPLQGIGLLVVLIQADHRIIEGVDGGFSSSLWH